MPDAVIVSAARTAIGRAPKGSLRATRPDDLAAYAIRAALERAPGLDPEQIDDVILGCASPEAEQGLDVARVAVFRAGLPSSLPAVTVNRFCASGLEAIAQAAAKIATGQAETVIAGGTESLSLVPFMGSTLSPNPHLITHLPDVYLGMGHSTERLARTHGITRDAADAFALESHRRALAAQDAGRFDEEITPVLPTPTEGQPEPAEFRRDEGPRRETSAEALAGLKPAFAEDGVITAGNASQRSDGAAALILTTPENAARLGLTPLARFAGYALAGVDPADFGIAPALALPKLFRRTGVSLDDIGLMEFNEAFAAQVLAADCLFPLPFDRVNVNGGAVALGHPLGATGARQTVTLLYEAKRRSEKGRKIRYGVVTMCAALGMGAAGLFEFA